MLDFVLLVVLGALVLPYVLGPILVYAGQRWPADPVFAPYDPIGHPLPDDVAAAFMETRDALTRDGFQLLTDVAHQNTISKAQLRIALLEAADPAGQELALVVAARSTNPRVRVASCYVEFPTKFADGGTLTVLNSRDPEVYPEVAARLLERFPDVRDPARLRRISRALVERFHAGRPRLLFDAGRDPVGFVRSAIAREYELQVGTGYLRRDEHRGVPVYRPTLAGAWAMTWRLLFPLRQLSQWRRRRRAAALLEELGLASADERPIAPPKSSGALRWNVALFASLVVLYFLVRDSGESTTRAAFRLPAGFSVPADFAGAVAALEALAADSAEPLMGGIDGVSVGVPATVAEGIVAAAHDSFLARGFYLFVAEKHYGFRQPDRLALFARADRYEIMGAMGTNGANYGIDTDSIARWLRALERDHPFVLDGIGFDWIGGRFTADIADPGALARRFYDFCPDIVDQGTGTVRALARELARERRLYCWWD